MNVLNRSTFVTAPKVLLTMVLVSTLLTACGSPDEEGMKAGLVKNGLNPEQASCYSGALKHAEFYGLDQSFLKEAIKQARLKHGENLVDGMSKSKDTLDACLK